MARKCISGIQGQIPDKTSLEIGTDRPNTEILKYILGPFQRKKILQKI
jgi:hypothetical protein